MIIGPWQYCTYCQEYIIGKRESILLHYDTVLQPFPGLMTFGVIYTCLLYHHSLLFVGMLASLHDIHTTTAVTTAGMRRQTAKPLCL